MKVSEVSKTDLTMLARLAAYLQAGEFLIKGSEAIRFGESMHWFTGFLKDVAAADKPKGTSDGLDKPGIKNMSKKK